MELDIHLASAQLSRMRAMTGQYHKQFMADTSLITVGVLGLFVLGWSVAQEAFLLIPVLALIGAVRTAFDASYLMFARWYSRCLEDDLNRAAGRRVLIASDIEASYLFPLETRKVVSVPVGGGQTWFSFVTVFYTLAGVAASAFGLALGWHALWAGPVALAYTYLVTIVIVALGAIVTGAWWFVGGEGERRLDGAIHGSYEFRASDAHRARNADGRR